MDDTECANHKAVPHLMPYCILEYVETWMTWLLVQKF